jgi:hypothetical protein
MIICKVVYLCIHQHNNSLIVLQTLVDDSLYYVFGRWCYLKVLTS